MKARNLPRCLAITALLCPLAAHASILTVRFDQDAHAQPLTGRLLILVSEDGSTEPRDQVTWGLATAQVFGMDVVDWAPGEPLTPTSDEVFGYPIRSLAELPSGEYTVQAVLHRYETFNRAAGPPVQLPASWAAGQR